MQVAHGLSLLLLGAFSCVLPGLAQQQQRANPLRFDYEPNNGLIVQISFNRTFRTDDQFTTVRWRRVTDGNRRPIFVSTNNGWTTVRILGVHTFQRSDMCSEYEFEVRYGDGYRATQLLGAPEPRLRRPMTADQSTMIINRFFAQPNNCQLPTSVTPNYFAQMVVKGGFTDLQYWTQAAGTQVSSRSQTWAKVLQCNSLFTDYEQVNMRPCVVHDTSSADGTLLLYLTEWHIRNECRIKVGQTITVRSAAFPDCYSKFYTDDRDSVNVTLSCAPNRNRVLDCSTMSEHQARNCRINCSPQNVEYAVLPVGTAGNSISSSPADALMSTEVSWRFATQYPVQYRLRVAEANIDDQLNLLRTEANEQIYTVTGTSTRQALLLSPYRNYTVQVCSIEELCASAINWSPERHFPLVMPYSNRPEAFALRDAGCRPPVSAALAVAMALLAGLVAAL